MRGGDKRTGELFSYVDLEKRVRSDHPLRAIRGLVNEALGAAAATARLGPLERAKGGAFKELSKFTSYVPRCAR